jgi:diguanylate cyclase (GGDEF)-like protein
MSSRLRRLLLALLIACGFFASGALAADAIVERGVLSDPDGSLDIGDVASGPFEPFTETFAGGFSRTVHWFRLVIRSPGAGEEVVLRIRPTVLDELKLYEAGVGPPASWPVRVTGDRYPFDERDRPAFALGFVVRPNAPESVYYLRLQTSSVAALSIEALSPREAGRKDHALDTLQLVFAGLMIWPLAWALQRYATDRDPVVGIFAFHQTVYLLYGLAVTGYLAPLGPAALIDRVTSVVVCLVLFSGALFARALLRGGDPPRALSTGMDLLLLVFPLQLIAMLAGRTELALGINAALMVASRWYFLLVALSLRKDGRPSRRFLQLAMLVLALLVTAILPANFGWVLLPDMNLRDAIALIVFGMVSTSLFVALLNARVEESRQRAHQTEVELLLTRQALEFEQGQKLRAEAEANTDDLTRLCNRRHFTELAEREILRSLRYRHPLTLLMLDLDHFKRVNDTWGHDAGDQVLRSVSEVLRGSLREVDVPARVGGEEFAILLIETFAAQGEMVAQRIRAAVERTPVTLADGTRLTITVSIGLAELGSPANSLRDLMREADGALYAAKQRGRNQVALAPIADACPVSDARAGLGGASASDGGAAAASLAPSQREGSR